MIVYQIFKFWIYSCWWLIILLKCLNNQTGYSHPHFHSSAISPWHNTLSDRVAEPGGLLENLAKTWWIMSSLWHYVMTRFGKWSLIMTLGQSKGHFYYNNDCMVLSLQYLWQFIDFSNNSKTKREKQSLGINNIV